MKTKTTKNNNAKEEDKKGISPKIENLDKVLDSSIASLFNQHLEIKKRHKDIIERQDALLRKHGGVHVKPSDIIVLNVRGEEMFVRRDTLTLIKDSRLEALFSGRWENQLLRDDQGRVFLDVDPGAFRRILEYLYIKKIAPPDQEGLLPTGKKGSGNEESMEEKLYAFYLDFFKLAGHAETTLGNSSSTTTGFDALAADKTTRKRPKSKMEEHKEMELLKDMKLELDAVEKKLESEESFVAFFTCTKANNQSISDNSSSVIGSGELIGSNILVDTSSLSTTTSNDSRRTTRTEDTHSQHLAGDDRNLVTENSGLINLYVNGEILVYKTSSITADKKSKLSQNLTNVEWCMEHSIMPSTKGRGQQCILMEYPRKEFKDLLNFFHMTGEPLCQEADDNTTIEDLLPESCVTENFQILAKYLCPCSRENLHRFLFLNMGMTFSPLFLTKIIL